MTQQAVSYMKSRSRQRFFRPVAVEGQAELGVVPYHQPVLPRAWRPTPEPRIQSVSRGIGALDFKGRLLFIGDDQALTSEQLHQTFPAPEYHLQVVTGVQAGLEHILAGSPDVIVLGLGGVDPSGLETYHQIRRIQASIPVIFVTKAGTADAAIEAMKQGAYDYLFKPLDLPVLHRTVAEALEVGRQMRQPATADAAALTSDVESAFVGVCPAMREVYKAIGRVAAQDVPVLITGESGTGKELVARALYQHSKRASAPFLAMNCAAIPEQLLESELFGHEKGAFTGADRRRIGKFEQTSGGTLFLDEIGDMPLALQAKMLRLLQDQAFERVGGNETVRTDVRLIAATHRDLNAASEQGRFRQDLYYRLGVFTIHLPPLRERAEDLPLLVRHFLRRFSRELGREVQEVAPEALERLRNYDWPGNIRELQSVLKQAILRCHGPVLLADFIPDFRQTPDKLPKFVASDAGCLDLETFILERLGPDSRDFYKDTQRALDRLLLPRVMEYTGGNQQRAALLLGIARQTLRGKLREVGLNVVHSLEAEEDHTMCR
jgi:two-component system nitrogen regulation response regulator GlnG